MKRSMKNIPISSEPDTGDYNFACSKVYTEESDDKVKVTIAGTFFGADNTFRHRLKVTLGDKDYPWNLMRQILMAADVDPDEWQEEIDTDRLDTLEGRVFGLKYEKNAGGGTWPKWTPGPVIEDLPTTSDF